MFVFYIYICFFVTNYSNSCYEKIAKGYKNAKVSLNAGLINKQVYTATTKALDLNKLTLNTSVYSSTLNTLTFGVCFVIYSVKKID